MRIGFGYDAHKLGRWRKLILGGVKVPFGRGLVGYSDADVLIHAIIDALIGAMSKGSIGDHFPDTDPKYKNISSLLLLKIVSNLLEKEGFSVNNIDTTIVCQKPKLSNYIPQMAKNISTALGINPLNINIKAKTEEKMGFTGKGQGIKAYAVCLIHKKVR